MKAMKFFALAAVVALGFTGCKEDSATDSTPKQLSIRLSNVVEASAATRAIENPGVDTASSMQLSGGLIFILNADNSLNRIENLIVAQARTGTGQVLTTPVPADSKVFIVGNTGAFDANLRAATSLSEVIAVTADASTVANYLQAPVANDGGTATGLTSTGDNTATASVTLRPLTARFELHGVTGSTDALGQKITGFDVTGVYMDNYNLVFGMDGVATDAVFNQGTSTTFAGVGDTAADPSTWTAGTDTTAAVPAAGKVWAYNLAASTSMPYLIVKIENVTAVNDTDTAITEIELGDGTTATLASQVFYPTVKTYDGATAFQRGRIYRVANLPFSPALTAYTAPNSTDVNLTVKVTVLDWVLVDVTPNI